MKPRQTLIIVSACLALQVLLHASPAHAALQSTGILDLATQHFQTSLAKWKPIFTQAALTLFWLLATVACVWELGSIALRGASMEAALSFLVRFAFIEGLWLYIILNAVPIETAIIDSFRKLGSTASGLRQELMPSEVLDLGFALLWKTTKFVAVTGWSAPIVALVALVVTLIIVLIFGLTAANMVLLVISQWFLVYGGIFFLGFGGAPWESDKAKNYVYLGLSIGAQFLGMAAVIGIGQSFIEAQYAQLSDDTALGELVVILLVGGLMFLLTNEIPKLFARFVPGSYNVNGFGIAAALGGMATAAAALAASGAMAKGAMEAMGGIAKAASAAKDAAKSQKQPQTPPRSQTGISSSSDGGSIGPAGGGGSSGAGSRTQGPLGTMLTTTGIGTSQPQNGASRTPPVARAGTSTAAKSTTTTPKSQANQNTQEGTENTGSRRSAGKPATSASPTAADETQPSAAPIRALTHANAPSHTDAHAPSTPAAAESENDERTGTAEAEISSGRRGDCEPLSDEATATSDAGVQQDTQNSTSPEPSAAHADTSPSSNDAPSEAPQGSEDASSMAPAHAAPTGVDGDADASAARPSTYASSSAATSTSTDPTSAPAAASNGTSSTTARSATAQQASAPTTTNTSAGTGAQNTPPSAATSATSGASEGGSTQSAAAQKARPPEAASGTTGAGEDSSGSSKPASATPASPDSEANTAPGGHRGSTSIGGGSTVLAAAKILGQHTFDHYRARGEHFKDAIMARVDNTTGGQIAQAIRKKHGLDQGSKDPAQVRSATTISDAPGSSSESDASPAQPAPRRRKHPAHWSSGDDPMTDDQLEFLERKFGDSFDLNMTKAEAAILIDELVHEE